MPRKAGYQHFQKTREKIQAGNLIHRMYQVAMGEVEATSAQINAAKALLNKVLPDLQSVEFEGDIHTQVTEVRKTIVDSREGS